MHSPLAMQALAHFSDSAEGEPGAHRDHEVREAEQVNGAVARQRSRPKEGGGREGARQQVADARERPEERGQLASQAEMEEEQRGGNAQDLVM